MVKTKTIKENKKKLVKRSVVTKSPMVNYPVGDFLIKVKNAALTSKSKVLVRNTKLINSVADVLKSEGYLSEIEKDEGMIEVTLARAAKRPVLIDLKLVSKPGLRLYMKRSDLLKLVGPEVYILSTPLGVVSSKTAKKKGVGGEVIAKVW